MAESNKTVVTLKDIRPGQQFFFDAYGEGVEACIKLCDAEFSPDPVSGCLPLYIRGTNHVHFARPDTEVDV